MLSHFHRKLLPRGPLWCSLACLCLAQGMVFTGCFTLSRAQDAPRQSLNVPFDNGVTSWPIALEVAEGYVEVYQPQPETMKGDTVTARAAVSLTRPGAANAVFGVVWFSARVIVDRDSRTVALHQITVSDARLTGPTPAEQQDFKRNIGQQFADVEVTFPQDQLMATLDTARREQIEEKAINTAPPRILISTTPATLISVNGPPKFIHVDGQDGVSRVGNTPFILLRTDADHHYYLKAGTRWVGAPDLPGPWTDAAQVPPAIAAAGVELATPATQPSAKNDAPAASAPITHAPTTQPLMPSVPTAVELAPAAADAKIIVVTDPAELIVTSGNLQFAPVPGGSGGELLYASNTASNLFLDQADHHYYVLLSGRWFAALSLEGPWQYVASDQLPPAFVQIPADSPAADVLPFVAGTTEAHAAVLDAGIPQTATIRRTAGADLDVGYDGAPQFQDVPECPGVAYALNTPEDVLRVNGQYFCCHQAVWYESATPTGPWTVSTSVPSAIYSLPPSCPDYHVRYAYIYDSSDNFVTCGYLPGYTGTYVYGPTIVYGTGYTYPGWDGAAYFPPPCTWGFSAYYDPFACVWGFDSGLYWDVGWFAHPWRERWWHDHPDERWGSHRWWGPGGFVHSHETRDRLTEARAGGPFRIGERDGRLAARMPDTDHRGPGWNNIYARQGNAGRVVPSTQLRPSRSAKPVSGARDNVFAGSDGSVFRRSNTGWEENRGAGSAWTGVRQVPEAQPTYRPSEIHVGGTFGRPEAGLEQHYAARSIGTERSSLGGGGFRGGGGFHAAGGGFHGGGGGHR